MDGKVAEIVIFWPFVWIAVESLPPEVDVFEMATLGDLLAWL